LRPRSGRRRWSDTCSVVTTTLPVRLLSTPEDGCIQSTAPHSQRGFGVKQEEV